MDVDDFWALVAATQSGVSADPVDAVEEQVGVLRQRLEALPDVEVAFYRARLFGQLARANDWRLWAAGYLAAGGMSDDSFDYFRLWLVHQGREAFERVLAEPDSLAELAWDDDGEAFGEAELLGYVAEEVLEGRGVDPESFDVDIPESGAPVGEPFDEDDDEWFAATFPRLWARVTAADASPGGLSDWDRITDADVTHFVESTRKAKEPRPVGPMAPLLAAVLYETGEIRHQDRPMLAAHWLADDKGGGDAVLELASLRGNEPEVSELWPVALEEVGVTLPVTRARVATTWAAQRVLNGERDAFWLAEFLQPRRGEAGDDPRLDDIARTLYAAVLEGRPVELVVAALARDDLADALRVLSADQ